MSSTSSSQQKKPSSHRREASKGTIKSEVDASVQDSLHIDLGKKRLSSSPKKSTSSLLSPSKKDKDPPMILTSPRKKAGSPSLLDSLLGLTKPSLPSSVSSLGMTHLQESEENRRPSIPIHEVIKVLISHVPPSIEGSGSSSADPFLVPITSQNIDVKDPDRHDLSFSLAEDKDPLNVDFDLLSQKTGKKEQALPQESSSSFGSSMWRKRTSVSPSIAVDEKAASAACIDVAQEEFDVKAFVEKVLESNESSGIDETLGQLKKDKEKYSQLLKKEVFDSYPQFIEASKDIPRLEQDALELRDLYSKLSATTKMMEKEVLSSKTNHVMDRLFEFVSTLPSPSFHQTSLEKCAKEVKIVTQHIQLLDAEKDYDQLVPLLRSVVLFNVPTSPSQLPIKGVALVPNHQPMFLFSSFSSLSPLLSPGSASSPPSGASSAAIGRNPAASPAAVARIPMLVQNVDLYKLLQSLNKRPSLADDFLSMVQQKIQSLVSSFATRLRHPSLVKSERKRLIQFLSDLGSCALGRDTFLDSKFQHGRNEIKQIKSIGGASAYVVKLSQFVFHFILETFDEFKESFPEPSTISAFIVWCTKILEEYVSVFCGHVFYTDHEETIKECLGIAQQYCIMLENVGLGLGFFLSGKLKRITVV